MTVKELFDILERLMKSDKGQLEIKYYDWLEDEMNTHDTNSGDSITEVIDNYRDRDEIFVMIK